ncbi:hypothetical protein M5689_014183 [Euphorbia peplus]|nr:hypothetical protein M5689_014183 [Euphorbia peplus]
MGMDEHKVRHMPTFGEWDANGPASAAEFAVIFSSSFQNPNNNDIKASPASASASKSNTKHTNDRSKSCKCRWFCGLCNSKVSS